MLRRLALALTLLTPAALSAAPAETFTLDNGMEVVVIEDRRAPVVVHMVWYKVGSADEPPGKSGIAHYLEHLMFKATETRKAGEFGEIVAANGGSTNAFTSYDYTAYFQRLAADRLPLVMEMEADRMENLALVEEDIATERDVVLEERAQRTDSTPGGLFAEQRRAAQYLSHPYANPIIGWRHEIEELGLADANAFYEAHYAPNNAILIVAGDVDAAEVRTLAEQYYGPIPADPAIAERSRPQEPPQRAERRLVFEDPRVAQPYVVRTYLAPERDPGAQETAAALVFLSEILGGSGATSVLGETLEFEEQRAVYTSAFYSGVSLDDTTFGLIAVPVPGVTLQEIEDDMDRVIADFLDTGVDQERFERLKTQLRASEIYALDSAQGRARSYGAAMTSGLTVEDVEAWPDVLAAVTPDDVMEAARMVFDRTNAVTGWLTPPMDQTEEEATQ
ncbi:MAG: M16 family metallopeptidase [Shimia sp.]